MSIGSFSRPRPPDRPGSVAEFGDNGVEAGAGRRMGIRPHERAIARPREEEDDAARRVVIRVGHHRSPLITDGGLKLESEC